MSERASIAARDTARAIRTVPPGRASALPTWRPRTLQAQLLRYQRTVGNRAVQKMVGSGRIAEAGERLPRPGRAEVAPAPAAAPRVQRAWYNFDIPFTDYQFDPSFEGVKTAAGIVKDAAASGLEWIVDQIKDLVSSGVEWLTDRWDSVQQIASSAFDAVKTSFSNIVGFVRNPLGFLADAMMNFDAEALGRAWAAFSGLVSTLANGFTTLAGTLMQQVGSAWKGIDGFATSLLARVAGLTDGFLFKRLPDALQRIAFGVVDRLKSLWKRISDGWTKLYDRINGWIDGAIETVTRFVRRVASFAIDRVVSGIVEFGRIVLFLKDLFADPRKYAEILAKRGVQAFEGVETRFAGVVGQYFGSGEKAAPQAAQTRRSATWGEIGHGVAGAMGRKWDEFKANPMAVVTQLLMDMVLPIVGNVNDVVNLVQEIRKIVTGPLGAGSLEELWTSLLLILDIPILIYRTVVGILMRSLMLPLIVASFIPHPVVKGIAAAVGYALLAAFVEAETMNLEQKLLLLKTGATTEAQKEEAYNRIADSLIALAMTAVIIVVMLILHFLAGVVKGVYNFVRTKVFRIEPVPVEGKGPESKPQEPPKDLGTEGGKKVLAEKSTADGKHQAKVMEDGIRCCSPSCPFLIEEIDAHVQENPALKEKLDPLRKRLETAQGELEAARLRQDRSQNPGEMQAEVDQAAQAAADVAAEVKPEIDRIVWDEPLPSGLRFNEYETPEAAIGMKEGEARLVGNDPVKEPAMREEGYTERHYYRDGNGKKWSVFVREVDGKPVYREGKPSSGQDFD